MADQSYRILSLYPRGLDDEYGWNVKSLSSNPSLSLSYVIEHPEGIYQYNEETESLELKQWNYGKISRYNNSILNHLTDGSIKIVWREINKRSDITWDLIIKHRHLRWDWEELSKRHDLDYQLVIDHPELPWSQYIPATPLQIVMKDLNQWSAKELSYLNFSGYLPGDMIKSAIKK